MTLILFLLLTSTNLLAHPVQPSTQVKDCPLVFNTDSLERIKTKQPVGSVQYLRTLLSLERSYSLSNNDRAGVYLPLIKSMAEQLKSRSGMAIWYYLIAYKQLKDSQLVSASLNCSKALDFFESQHDTLGMAYGYHLMIRLHINIFGKERGSLNQANLYLQKIMSLSSQTKISEVKLIDWLSEISYYYTAPHQTIKKIKELAQVGLKVTMEQRNYRSITPKFLNWLSICYHFEKKYNNALTIQEQCLALTRSDESLNLLLINYNIGNEYLALGKYRQAELYYRKSLKIAHEKLPSATNTIQAIYTHYLEIALLQKKFKIAYSLRDSIDDYESKIRDIERTKEFNELQIKYETEKKERENQLLKKDKQLIETQNRFYLIIIIASSILLAIIACFVVFALRINRKLSRLAYFRDQIFLVIAHDLRSPFTAFEGLSKQAAYLLRKGEYDTLQAISQSIDETIIRTNLLLNNLLAWSLSQNPQLSSNFSLVSIHKVAEETKTIYESIAQTRQITIDLLVAPDLMLKANQNGIAVVFRNLLDNAIKYSQGDQIQIKAESENQQVIIQVKNDGKIIPDKELSELQKVLSGYDQTKIRNTSSLGLRLVYFFINQHRGTITVTSSEFTGTLFTVRIPQK